MVELGTAEGVRTVALLTDMSTPLGLTVATPWRYAKRLRCRPAAGRWMLWN